MLHIKNIQKKYVTGDLVQMALDNVSLTLRENEFVAILGPSGSGKTTLLNIIGGLDRYDSGDLIINDISTKKYKDRDWDSYRNHTIGFVFQSYNLIPHQNILSNVELALTISGVSKSERKKRAKEALEKVGLGAHIHKKPNQLSGGQMQRVAIARALVNDPKILLADEPTGALDSETSVQVMEMLKEVAKDRLVVMVTHNPELAETYATRTVRLRDGKIIDDTNPYEESKIQSQEAKHKNMGKSSMSYFTSLALSFNNLKTKKARTFLTAFAGSIGIIGIALILSLSNGVNNYIEDIQRDTMTSYPISIEAQTMDLSSFLSTSHTTDAEVDHSKEGVYSNAMQLEMASAMTASVTENNLTEFKKYIENPDNNIDQYVGETGIVYTYDTQFGVYTFDSEDTLVKTDGSTLNNNRGGSSMMGGMPGMGNMVSMMGGTSSNFEQLLPGKDGELVSKAITENYDLLYGSWPTAYDEVVLVLSKSNDINATSLYELGLLPTSEYRDVMQKITAGEEVVLDPVYWSYEEISKHKFYMIPNSDLYKESDNGIFRYIGEEQAEIKKLFDDAVELKISGIIRPDEDLDNLMISQPLGYTQALTNYIIDYTNDSAVVKAQLENKEINVTNGMNFAPSDDATKIEDAKTYFANMGISEKANMFKEIIPMAYGNNPEMAAQMMAVGEAELAATLDGFMVNADDQMMLSMYDTYISTGTYDENMKAFGVISYDAPSGIHIYVDSFEAKDQISNFIKEYNDKATEENKIVYTDLVGLLMSSITTIIDVISYVLIAFVSVSLVVSSIMIGIITYISVLERTKEIGILRAIGASKRNISQVFNAETFIVGLFSGLLGVGISGLILIPGNMIIHAITGTNDVSAQLPMAGAIILVILSVILTLIGGFIPAKKAAKKDPVTALRTE